MHLNNLTFAYQQKTQAQPTTVLEIEDLTIANDKITFLLGPSGIGKSTLLQSIGMMRKTYSKGEITLELLEESYNDLWEDRGDQRRASIRKDHFSFIFQENYMMPDYSIEDNVWMPYCTQFLEVYEEDIDRLQCYLDKFRLTEEMLAKRPNEISVGEKQRFAFIQALLKDFDILFADEPTGNLDIANSDRAFEILKEHIRESNEDQKRKTKSAVIVSHDLHMACAHADEIVLFLFEDEKGVLKDRFEVPKEKAEKKKLQSELRELMKQNI